MTKPKPFTVDHFKAYASRLVFDDGQCRSPEDWQLAFVEDLFAGRAENWLLTPEGNGKTSFTAQLAVYGADFTESPWIPVAAASAKQARILHNQAGGFIRRTEGLGKRLRVFDGYLKITSRVNGGTGIEVFAADPKTGDGVIPFPFAIVDEGHRQEDMRLYGLWKGKLRKRGAQIIMLSTAGEPETPFEKTRDEIRRRATERTRGREQCFLRAASANLVMHEYMVPNDEATKDMRMVKLANPLWTITENTLTEDYASPTLELLDWKRLKCNRPTRSVKTAITDSEWDAAEVKDWIEAQIPISAVGFDVAFKWDTTAIVPVHKGSGGEVLIGPARILVPPRDGTTLHPDEIKRAFVELAERNPIDEVVMDMSKAEDIASWLEDELDLVVIDRDQNNPDHVADYNAFMSGLRNGKLKHTGDAELRSHVLNAIARRLPMGDYRFDRPTDSRRSIDKQDRRVIDGLTAAAMAVERASQQVPEQKSVYETRGLVTA